MRKKPKYDIILFTILMVFLFMPLLQGLFHLIPVKPLSGVTHETEKPTFSLASLRTGDFAQQEETYVSEHFGFREPVIRLYNQYLWSCYKKTYAHDVVAGKRGWLYTPESVRDYYGTEMPRWQHSPEAAKQRFDREVRYLNRVRTLLKENDVELLAFIAPEKSYLYPEYLPERQRDTSTFNACDYFVERFREMGFPCIEMTRWFQQMKDTVSYPLIPQTGAHWVFPAVYAADSLFRYMGDLKGVELPRLQTGTLHENDNHGADNDLERLLNLMLPIRKRTGYCPTAEVRVESSPRSVKPKVLFVGNSFMWGIANQVPMREVFDEVEFWYYFSTTYTGDPLEATGQVVDYNLLEKLLDFDYIVWFTTANQLNKGTMGFANAAILTLAVDDSTRIAAIRRIADTCRDTWDTRDKWDTWDRWDTWDTCRDISNVSATDGRTRCVPTDSLRLRKARTMLYNHPEWIAALSTDSLTTRNKEIPYARYTKDIRKDSTWMAALEAQAFLRTATMQQMLHAEVDRIKAGKPLYKDQSSEIAFGLRCRQETEDLARRIPNNEKMMASIKEKAAQQGKTLEKAINDDARWLIRRKYHLERCRLIDNPDAEIPLPNDL